MLLVLQSELFANEQLPPASDDPRVAAALSDPLVSELFQHRRRRDDAGAPDPALRAADGRRDGPRGRRPREGRGALHRDRGRRPDHGDLPAGTRAAAPAGEVPRLRLVVPAFRAGAHRPGRRRPRRRPLHRLGRPARRPARLPRRVLGRRRRRGRRRLAAAAGGALRRCSTCCRPAPAPRAGRSRRRASPGPATTGTRSGTPRRSCCRCWPHACRRPPRTRCAGGSRSCRWPSSGPSSSGLQGAAFPWRTIRGQECSGYWPAGTAAFHINADIADAVLRYVIGDRRPRLRARHRARAAGRRPPGCGARSAITTPRASSASTA